MSSFLTLTVGNTHEPLVTFAFGWMRETAASSAEAAPIYRDVGVPLVEGLMAFHKGDYHRAVDLLYRIRYDVWQIGGSHAQRDVVDRTLAEAAVRGGLRDVAVALAYERLGTRPRLRWRRSRRLCLSSCRVPR
jgi:hypothetical protein